MVSPLTDILCFKRESGSDCSCQPSLILLLDCKIKRGAGALCQSRNASLRRSEAEQRDAPGKPGAKLCCGRARELCV